MSKHITKFDLGMLAQLVDQASSHTLSFTLGINEEVVNPALAELKPQIEAFAEANPHLSRLDIYHYFQPQILEILSNATTISMNNSY